MLKQCFRVLKPGGVVRITTPDLVTLIELYAESPSEPQANYIRYITDNFITEVRTYNPVFVINNAFRNWGHKFLYDGKVLADMMVKVGLINVTEGTPNKSEHKHLQAV